jgi:hypothetical protein
MGGVRAPHGQGPFQLRVVLPQPPATIDWSRIKQGARPSSGQIVGGLRYLGFSLRESDTTDLKAHRAIAEGVRFTVLCRTPQAANLTAEAARAYLASWWLFLHLGGLGSRARRGFGSLALEGWSWPDREDVLSELPLPCVQTNRESWRSAMVLGLSVLDGWRGGAAWPVYHPHPRLGAGAEVVFQSQARWRRGVDALEDAGVRLSLGRREHRGPAGEIDGRVTLGLPLETGVRPTRNWKPAGWDTHAIESGVHASPLHIHVGAFQGGLGLVWTRMAGPAPGLGVYRVREARSRAPIRSQAPDTLGALVAGLEGERWFPGATR